MPGTPIDSWQTSNSTAPKPSSDEVAKQAIQDTARHEEQLVKLILFHDDRALRVLAVYVPVIGALITAAIALSLAGKLDLFVGSMMGGVGISLLIGCFHAFAVVWTAPIYLPSRKPIFWQWAMQYDVGLQAAASAYIEQSIEMVAHNERHSAWASTNLTKAYICGIAAPFVGAAIVWIIYWGNR